MTVLERCAVILYNGLSCCLHERCCVHQLQVAAWWAEQRLDDFAVIPQPFFSGASAANFSIDFISTVRRFH